MYDFSIKFSWSGKVSQWQKYESMWSMIIVYMHIRRHQSCICDLVSVRCPWGPVILLYHSVTHWSRFPIIFLLESHKRWMYSLINFVLCSCHHRVHEQDTHSIRWENVWCIAHIFMDKLYQEQLTVSAGV